jgi:hypothetical protein
LGTWRGIKKGRGVVGTVVVETVRTTNDHAVLVGEDDDKNWRKKHRRSTGQW